VELKRVPEQTLSGAERERAHVVAFEPQDVEHVQEHRNVVLVALRQTGEAGLRALERHHLAVDGELLASFGRERFDQLGIALVLGKIVA